MTFTARIRRASPVWRHWIEQHLKRASLCAVPFVRTPGNDFVFDGIALSADQIAVMRANPCVDLEVRGSIGGIEVKAVVDPTLPPDVVEFRDREDVRVGAIVNLGVADTNMGEAKEPAVYVQPRHASRDNRHQRRGR